jgi:hypothetical protein
MRIGTGIALGVGALGVLGGGIAIAAHALGGDDDQGPADAGAAASTHAGTLGLSWNPGDPLPTSLSGGVRQAEFAQATLRNLDTSHDGTLGRDDTSVGEFGGSADNPVVAALIARYDQGGDDRIDADEAGRIGADVANSDGVITASALSTLRRSLADG